MDNILKKINSQIENEIESKYLELTKFDTDCESTFQFTTDNDAFLISATIEIYNYCGNEFEPIYNYPTHEMKILYFEVLEAYGIMTNLNNIKNYLNNGKI